MNRRGKWFCSERKEKCVNFHYSWERQKGEWLEFKGQEEGWCFGGLDGGAAVETWQPLARGKVSWPSGDWLGDWQLRELSGVRKHLLPSLVLI